MAAPLPCPDRPLGVDEDWRPGLLLESMAVSEGHYSAVEQMPHTELPFAVQPDFEPAS